jgi:thiamine-monophosphate kinase
VSDEGARVEMLRAILAGSEREGERGVRVGIGDDAAVIAADAGAGAGAGAGARAGGGARARELVWTVDAQVDGTHFRRAWLSWRDVGWRSFMAAASDLAAMGAEPVAALSSLVLAPDVDDAALEELARGQREAADAIGLPIAGGNLARGTETSITTTALGRAERAVLRSGARPGEALWLAGPVGLAAAGLAALEARAAEGLRDARVEPGLRAWRRPIARIADGRAMAASAATAAVDVSDGLARDVAHLASASGVRAALDAAALLAHAGAELAAAAAAVGRAPLDLALHGGEDYALVAASPSAIPGFTRIGTLEARGAEGAEGAEDDRGAAGASLVLVMGDGARRALDPRGFDHFR